MEFMNVKSQTSKGMLVPDEAKENRTTSPTDASNGLRFFNTHIGCHRRHCFDHQAPFGYQAICCFSSGIFIPFSLVVAGKVD